MAERKLSADSGSDTSEFEVLPKNGSAQLRTTTAATVKCSVETAGMDRSGNAVPRKKYMFKCAQQQHAAKVARLVPFVCQKLSLEESSHKFSVQSREQEEFFDVEISDEIEHCGHYKVLVEPSIESEEEKRRKKECIIKIKNPDLLQPNVVVDGGGQTHVPEVFLEVCCPRSVDFGGQCPRDEYKWACGQCGEWKRVQKGKSGQGRQQRDDVPDCYFYCSCGRAKAEEFVYRCKHADQHGDQFVPFSSKHLPGVLRQLGTFGERNVLILGQTGVGKSTWINAFANYLQYNTLEEALEFGPKCVLPAKFNEKGIEVQVGEPPSKERSKKGSSDTKYTVSHLFPYKGGKLHLIDTPGIGDTAGQGQDKRNLANILDHIANTRHIHGVCILLKPSEARLTPEFKYCLEQLFAQLHKSVSKNLLFCFTNTRQTDYAKGETFPIIEEFLQELKLEVELNEDNTFHMDNEAFRHLWASKRGIEYSEARVSQYKESWRKSQQETHRLLSRVNSLEPHHSMETLSVNDARRIIGALQQPMASMTKKIQKNIAKVNHQKDELLKLDLSKKENQDKLMPLITVIECRKLGHSRRVCTTSKCTRVGRDSDGNTETKYNVCHEDYNSYEFHKGIMAVVSFGITLLNHTCGVCHCEDGDHKVIDYEQIDVEKRIEDKQIARLLQENALEQKIRQQAIDGCEKKIGALEGEQKRIFRIAAKFSAFLKHNAITPYEDELQIYMEKAIQEAEKLENEQQHSALRNSLDKYSEQKGKVDGPEAQTIKPADIQRYVEELSTLALMGESIKSMLIAEKCSREEKVKFMETDHSEQIVNNPVANGFSRPAKK